MATDSLSLLTMQGTNCLNDSMIISLLDYSWYSQSILSHSIASCVPLLQSERAFRSSEAESATGSGFSSAEEKSTSQSIDDHRHVHWKRCYPVDESELRRVFDRFDENADGLISLEELGRYMRCCYGKDMSDEEVNSMVSCVDRNNDGAVDFEEFLSLYQNSRGCSDDDAMAENTSRQDEEEREDLLQTFRLFDRNQDGFISAHELQAVLLNLGMPEGKSLISCEKMIRNVDRDGDGQCDLREFQEMMSVQSS